MNNGFRDFALVLIVGLLLAIVGLLAQIRDAIEASGVG